MKSVSTWPRRLLSVYSAFSLRKEFSRTNGLHMKATVDASEFFAQERIIGTAERAALLASPATIKIIFAPRRASAILL